MGKLAAVTCESAKPDKGRDRLLGDGDGLYLRVRPHGTKTWLIEYEFNGSRTKYTIGVHDREGAPGDSIPDWLRHGRLSLTQARAIAGNWKDARRAGHDPAAEWEAQLAREREAEAARKAAEEAETTRPTVSQTIDTFMARHMAGKKSAPAIRYRLDRLAADLGERKIRDVTRKDVIAALDKIADGQREGQTAKQLAGEVLVQAKRLWRFAEAREWVEASCIEKLTRKDFDARPVKRDVTLRLDELAEIWRALQDPQRCKSDPVTRPDLVRDVLRERGRYVSAALTIIRAWIVAGRPKTECKSLASYGDWSDLCRQPLLWLGCADPTASVFQAMAEDPDRETLARLLNAWFAGFGKTPAMVRDAVKQAHALYDEHAELREVLRDIADERGEINRRKLGWWIRRHAGRIVDGMRIVRATGNGSAERWRIEVVESVS